jgi:hypothetical protein
MGSVHRRPRYAGPLLVGVYPIPQILGIIDNSQLTSVPGHEWSTTSPAVIGPGKELGNFGLDGSHQQRTRAMRKNFGRRIGESPCWTELENASLHHGRFGRSVRLQDLYDSAAPFLCPATFHPYSHSDRVFSLTLDGDGRVTYKGLGITRPNCFGRADRDILLKVCTQRHFIATTRLGPIRNSGCN